MLSCSNDEKEYIKTEIPTQKIIGQVIYNPFQTNNISLKPFTSFDLQIYNSNEVIVGNRNHPDNSISGDFTTDYVYFTSFDNSLVKNFEKYPVGSFNFTTRNLKLKIINNEIYLLYAYGYPVTKNKLLKLNSNGEILFDFALPDNFYYTDFVLINNKFYLVSSGYNTGTYNDTTLLRLTILDKEGNMMNHLTYKNYTYSSDIITVNNQLFISSTKFIKFDNNKPVVLKSDLNGTILSETQIENFNNSPTSMFPKPFYIRKGTDAIYSVSNGYGHTVKNAIAKLDFSGNIIWSKSITITNFPYSDFEFIEDFELDSSNNLYLFGSINEHNGFGPRRIAIAKYDSNGNFVKSYIHKEDGEQWGRCLEIYNNEIYTTSSTYSFTEIALMKFDLNLNVK